MTKSKSKEKSPPSKINFLCGKYEPKPEIKKDNRSPNPHRNNYLSKDRATQVHQTPNRRSPISSDKFARFRELRKSSMHRPLGYYQSNSDLEMFDLEQQNDRENNKK